MPEEVSHAARHKEERAEGEHVAIGDPRTSRLEGRATPTIVKSRTIIR
jgi:hypothetical protein